MAEEQTDTTKCPCGMPLDKNTRCECEPGKCIHCCECPEDCGCECEEKAEKEEEDEEPEDDDETE